MAMKREEAKETAKKTGHTCPDAWMRANCPTVVSYLWETAWDDGKGRETSTLTIFLEDGCLKLALNDRACMRSLYVTSTSLQDALKTMEEALREGVVDWRAWKGSRKK